MTFLRTSLFVLAALLLTALPVQAQSTVLTRSTISAAASAPMASSGGSFILGSTVGQTAPGTSQSASFRLASGYWPSVTNAAPPPSASGTLYVDVNATGANNGSSWADAFTDLQDALAIATPTNQIWIADGTYVPVTPADPSNVTSAERQVSFRVSSAQDGLRIYGGFLGGEQALSDRDVAGNPPAILSGDIGALGDPSDNSYHVLFFDGTAQPGITSSTVLDGVTITGGRAFGTGVDRDGGGLYCDGRAGTCSPQLVGVTFEDNSAASGGGAIYADGTDGTSSPEIRDAAFRSNSSSNDGGAIFSTSFSNSGSNNPAASSPLIVRTTFTDNEAAARGGAIFVAAASEGSNTATNSMQIINSVFASNTTFEASHALYLDGGGDVINGVIDAQVVGSVFVNNGNHHVRYNDGTGTPPRFVNCTFTGAAFSTVFSDPLDSGGGPLEIINSILFGDGGDVVTGFTENPNDPATSLDPTVDVTYSVVQEASFVTGSANNINADPLFTNASDPDGTDDTFATLDDGLRLQAGSPALDAGDDTALPSGLTTDLAGQPRVQGSAVDLGAYERAPAPPANQPPIVATPIADQTLQAGGPPFVVDLATVFSDPDPDPLTYTVTTTDPDASVSASISGSTLTVEPLAETSTAAQVTVTADDGTDTVSEAFAVTVTPAATAAPPLAIAFESDEVPSYEITQVEAGQTFALVVRIGTPSAQVTDLYGVGFELNYDPAVVEAGSSPQPGDFLTNGGNDNVSTFLDVDETAGTLAYSITRQNPAAGVTGNGVVATFTFEVLDAASAQSTTFGFSNVQAVNRDGTPIALDPQDATLEVVELLVWPGDTNDDGTPNGTDVLVIGSCFGLTGPARAGGYNIQWAPQVAEAWNFPAADPDETCDVDDDVTPNPAYVDADGNGQVDQNDVLPVGVNFNKMRSASSGAALAARAAAPGAAVKKTYTSEASPPEASTLKASTPVATVEVPPLVAGDRTTLAVELGTDAAPVERLMGVAVRVAVPAGLAFEQAAPGALLGTEDLVSLATFDEARGELAVAYSRRRGDEPIAGTGVVMLLELQAATDQPAGATLAIVELEVSTTTGIQSSAAGDPLPAVALDARSGPLPVELVAFDAQVEGRVVRLQWTTASETNNSGFAVERKVGANPGGSEASFEPVAFVEGQGTTSTPHTYRFDDRDLPFGTTQVTYRLKQVDLDGSATNSAPVDVRLAAPSALVLHGPFPNPVREQATIRYEVPAAGGVHLAVYDALGRQVATLVDRTEAAGQRAATFQAGRLSSGTYFVRLVAGGRVQTRPLVVVR